MNNLIVKDLTVSYDKKTVLENFNLTVKNKELVVILGPSGCGKSTLLSSISGLIKPSDGSIAFGDNCLFDKQNKINMPVEMRNIGFVFQSYALWPHMDIYSNIAYPLKVRKYSRSDIKKQVEKILKVVDMQGYEKRYPNELSGGEKQRIALARSLVYEPSILLLDEPLANLDANLKASLICEIKSIQQKLGITMIYVTHDQNEAFEIADRIVIMKEGKIMQQGSPREIYCKCKNLFVADFIGKNNILKTCDLKPCFIKNMKKCHCNNAITIRPEDIEITSNGDYKGKIKDVLYKGDRTEYIIETNDTSLLARTNYDTDFKKGSKVSFNIKRYHVL
jgi:ABC-type Fe3+/spermidine/putrescine transport system ATPase subunit